MASHEPRDLPTPSQNTASGDEKLARHSIRRLSAYIPSFGARKDGAKALSWLQVVEFASTVWQNAHAPARIPNAQFIVDEINNVALGSDSLVSIHHGENEAMP